MIAVVFHKTLSRIRIYSILREYFWGKDRRKKVQEKKVMKRTALSNSKIEI